MINSNVGKYCRLIPELNFFSLFLVTQLILALTIRKSSLEVENAVAECVFIYFIHILGKICNYGIQRAQYAENIK